MVFVYTGTMGYIECMGVRRKGVQVQGDWQKEGFSIRWAAILGPSPHPLQQPGTSSRFRHTASSKYRAPYMEIRPNTLLDSIPSLPSHLIPVTLHFLIIK